MEDLIINFTPTGMIPTKTKNPHVPISVNEIVEEVHEAFELGITMVHLHAREEESGVPTYKKEVYGRILEGLRKYCPELVMGVSLSGRNTPSAEHRSEVLELLPDLGSLTLSSLNFPGQASINSPETIVGLVEKMSRYGVKPELEVFDHGMVNYAKYLIRKSLLKAPFYFNIILGNIAGLQLDFLHLGTAIRDLPEGSLWAAGGIGRAQLGANSLAIAMGGGVRVGLEDNIYFDKAKKKSASNKELLLRIHELAEIHERKIMKATELGQAGFYNSKYKRKGCYAVSSRIT